MTTPHKLVTSAANVAGRTVSAKGADGLTLGPTLIIVCLIYFRSIKRHSQAFYNRAGLMSLCNAPSYLKVLDFLSQYKKPQPPVNLRLAKTPQTTDTWRQKPIHLTPPARVDVSGKCCQSISGQSRTRSRSHPIKRNPHSY